MNNIIETIQRHTPESERSWCLPAPARTDGRLSTNPRGVCVYLLVSIYCLLLACVMRIVLVLDCRSRASRVPSPTRSQIGQPVACTWSSYINNAIILSLCWSWSNKPILVMVWRLNKILARKKESSYLPRLTYLDSRPLSSSQVEVWLCRDMEAGFIIGCASLLVFCLSPEQIDSAISQNLPWPRLTIQIWN